MDYKTHKHYDLAYQAHYNTSHEPDKRAEEYCKEFDTCLAELQSLKIPTQYVEKWERMWLAHMRAKSRCISSVITGRANFPVAKAEKAHRAFVSSIEVCYIYYNNLVKKAKRDAKKAANPEAFPIASDSADALGLLKSQLEKAVAAQETMKAANAIIRKKPVDMDKLAECVGSMALAEELCEEGRWYGKGYASFELSNNNANIKRIKARIYDIERNKSREHKEVTFFNDRVRVEQDTNDLRLRVYFTEGKPSPTVVQLMKSKGFKWAPSVGAWQRLLNDNALFTLKRYVLPELKTIYGE